MTRRIAVVTGTRAEYGLLRPVLEALVRRPGVKAGLIVTGVHLSREYGYTRRDIAREGFPIWAVVPIYRKLGRDFSELPAALARATAGLDRAYRKCAAQIAVILGDRLEAFAAAQAGYFGHIVVAHIHGGEKSDHHLDDATRHAISRLAHLHFPASAESADRLARVGEEPFRIHCAGAPGLDALARMEPVPRECVAARYGLDAHRPIAVFLFHPETADWRRAGAQAARILAAMRARKLQVVALYPNGDPGSDAIIARLQRQAAPIAIRRHLPRGEFLQLLAQTDALVGNSSCGLIEASFLGTPTLNLGQRNRGREHGANVVFAPIERAAIARGLATVLAPRFKARARRAPCPWGDGTAGVKIAAVLARVKLDARLLSKRLACP